MNRHTIPLGKDVKTKMDVLLSNETPNSSFLITGLSGSGKTRAMWSIMDRI